MTTRGPIIRVAAPTIEQLVRQGDAGGTIAGVGVGTSRVLVQELNSSSTNIIDTTNRWVAGITGTGALTNTSTSTSARQYFLLNCPAGADEVRLTSRANGPNPLSITAANEVFTKVVLEFNFRVVNLANINNAAFFMGFQSGASANTRAGTDIIGFKLLGDVLGVMTDAAGTETVADLVTAPASLTAWNKCKIVLRNGSVDFYVNGVLDQSITTNLPANPLYINFTCTSEALVAAALHVTHIVHYALE